MARKPLFTDVFETDTFNEWRLKTNSIKLNLQDMFDEIDAFPNIAVMLVGDQTVDGVKSYLKKSNWTKEYTQNEVTPLLELKVTNSMANGSNVGHQGTGPAIDFYNPDTTGPDGKSHLVSRIASITERTGDIFPDASLVFFTGKNTKKPTEKMRINSDGQVGIGISSPNSGVQLSIQTADNNSVVSIQSKGDKFAALTFGDDRSHKSGQIQYHNVGNSMRFLTGEHSNGNSAERLRITNAGSVGIGTTSPSVKLDVVGDLKTSGFVHAGEASGGVALTLNDGYGNANVAFNHAYGKPAVNGSSARIETAVDETTGKMIFEVGDNSIANSTRNLTQVMQLKTDLVDIFTNTAIHGRAAINSKLAVGGDFDGDFDLCVGARSDEAGHVALNAEGGAISLRPLKNTTHAWLINAFDSPGGDLAITSRKRNTTTNSYDDTHALRFRSIDASISIPNNLTIGKTTKSTRVLIGDTWNNGSPQGGNVLYIKDQDVHSNYDPHGTPDGNGNYYLDKNNFPLIISDDNSNTSGPNSHGIVLYNASGTAGSFAPSILFASREAGNTDYRSATAGIYCRSPLAVGGNGVATGEVNTNYGDGELIFATSGVLNDGTTNSQGVTQRMVIDRSGKVGIGVSAPTTTLDVDGEIKSTGNLFIGNDNLPSIIISDGAEQNTEFSIFHSSTANTLSLGPRGRRRGVFGSSSRLIPSAALTINRSATIDIPRGGTVNVVGSTDKALVNRKFVEDLVAGNDQLGGLTSITLNRNDTNLEGGELIFKRSSDNTDYWHIDTHGSTSTPSLRFFHENDGADATVSMYITSSDRVGIKEANPDWDLCIGGKSTDAGSVAINAEGGVISLRPLKNTTHAWSFNAFDAVGGNAAIQSREYIAATGKYRDTSILRFSNNGDTTNRGKFYSAGELKSGSHVIAGGDVYTGNNVLYGSGGTGWLNHSRQNQNGDFFEIASRKADDSNWNYGSGFRQYKSGSVNIGGSGEKAGYQLYVDGSVLLKKDADIIQDGKVTPSGWGGGLTTFDIYSDGGTIAVGKAGSKDIYFNRDGNGFVKNALDLGYTPTKNSHAVRKDYVDAKFNAIITDPLKNTFSGRTAFSVNSEAGTITSHVGSRIPSGKGKHSHGLGFVSKFTTTSGNDGGGISIDVTDSNGDELAICAYNVNPGLNREIFHVRAQNGDIFSSGDFYNLKNIGTEGRIHIGKTGDYHYISKHASNGLQLGYTNAAGSRTGLRVKEDGTVALGKNGTANGDLVNKKYVDDKITAVTNSVQGNYKIVSGAAYVTSGFTNQVGSFNESKNYFDVYPPSGYKMSDLEAFLPSIHVIHFAGGVDRNDSIKCHHRLFASRIRVYVQGTEQRAAPAANYIAVWRNS